MRGGRYTATDNDGNFVRCQASDTLNSDENHANAVGRLCKKMGWKGKLIPGQLMHAGRQSALVWVWVQSGAGSAAALEISNSDSDPGLLTVGGDK